MKFKGFAARLTIAVVIAVVLIVSLFVFFDKIIGVLLYILKLLLPFLLAFLISLAANPLAERLQKKFKLPKGLTAILVIILIVGIVGGGVVGIVWKLVSEMKEIYLQIPQIYESVVDVFERLRDNLSAVYNAFPTDIQETFDMMGERLKDGFSSIIKNNYKPVVTSAGNVAKALPSIFIGIIVFILALYFMISTRISVRDMAEKVMPKKAIDTIGNVFGEIKKYISGYFKAQAIIMSIAFVIIFIGMSVLNIRYAMIIALVVAIFDALPFFGSGAVLIPWSIISFISSDIRLGVGLLIIYLAVILTRQMVEPKIVSSKIGLHPLLTLLSMYIGYNIFSIGGMILGPVFLMLIFSFYKAGAFNGIILLLTIIYDFIKKQIKTLYNYLIMK